MITNAKNTAIPIPNPTTAHSHAGALAFLSLFGILMLSSAAKHVSLLSVTVSFPLTLFFPPSRWTVLSGYCRPLLSGGIHTVSLSARNTVSNTTVRLTVEAVSPLLRLCRRRQRPPSLAAPLLSVQPVQML